MLTVELNRANYEYDINSLMRAFYPGETVMVLTPESTLQRRIQAAKEQEERKSAGESLLLADVCLETEGARIRLGERMYGWRYEPGDPGREEETDGKREAPDYKHEFKRFLYGVLKDYTGRSLPWGSLTGIRPTKIAYGMLEEGRDEQEILNVFTQRYEVSREKALLGLAIARREREILKDVNCGQGYSLYIGIPFCPTTCMYCSFTSYPIGGYRKLVDAYIDCLVREMEYVAGRMSGRILDSVYIGGGTPTTLEPGQLDRLLSALKAMFDFSSVKEFTVEAGRADSITEEKLGVLYRHQVGRISVNPQTMKQETLELIGRKATVEQVRSAYRLAREVGFTNINMDIILGLPGESETDVRRTVDEIAELGPDSLTVHSLAVKRASNLGKWIRENGMKGVCGEANGIRQMRNTEETMAIAAEGAGKMGMEPYYLYRQKNMSGNFENVGYAKPGKYGLYNILIMEEVQSIVALGAGSITKAVWPDGRIERSDNVKDVSLYIARIDELLQRKEKLLSRFPGE